MRGRLIAVEGLDGTGKTTLSRGLAEALDAVWTTTPPPGLRAVRDVLDAACARHPVAAQLFYASAVVAAAEQALDHLVAGRDVVFDRYWLTTCVYAEARGRLVRLPQVERLLPPADVTILVELDEPERIRRLLARGASDHDRDTLDPRRAAAIGRAYRMALRRPIAGIGVVLDVTGLGVPQAVRAAARCIEEVAPRPGRAPRHP